jgi:hypothetical protein
MSAFNRELEEAGVFVLAEWARKIPVDPPSSIEIRPAMDHEAAGTGRPQADETASS